MNWSSMNITEIKTEFNKLGCEERSTVIEILKKDTRKGVITFADKILRDQEKEIKERLRIKEMWKYENAAYNKGYHYVAGTDEVGRGPLAGPVVAASVVLPRDAVLMGINDSKKLTEKKREQLAEQIKEVALSYSVKEISAEIIDKLNILHAAELAMSESVAEMSDVDFLLVDGTNIPPVQIAYQNIIKGDSKSISIAAASILAKVYRDHLMEEWDSLYPEYGFAQNKGYGTNEHYTALRKYGPSPIHRRSFRLY